MVAETGARWSGDRKVKDGYVVVLKVSPGLPVCEWTGPCRMGPETRLEGCSRNRTEEVSGATSGP